MDSMTITRVEATPNGLWIRGWIDDERGRHIGTVEHFITATVLAHWWVEVRAEQDRAQQDPLPFDV